MRAIMHLLSIATLISVGCSDTSNPAEPGGGAFDVGTFTTVATTSLGPAGGKVTVAIGPASGMEIVVPPQALPSTWSFVVSTAEIKGHSFGADIRPLSPMIRVECPAEFAEQPMHVSVPIQLPAGHFAMGFFYDEESGELEGLPTIALTSSKITMLTSHLSGRFLSDGRKGGILGSKPYVQILISAIALSELQEEVSSGFLPGVDDWEFRNEGGYVQPDGNCAGMTVSASWYYNYQRRSAAQPPLNGRFDLYDEVKAYDEVVGRRFVDIIQQEIQWSDREVWLNAFETASTGSLSHDSLHYYTTVYAIKVTKQPQYIAVRRTGGGHALTAYAAGGETMKIADPNYPGDRQRQITFGAGGNFTPYSSGPNARELGRLYPTIHYIAKSAILKHVGIESRYQQLVQGTIGSIAPNTYPQTTVEWFNGTAWVAAPDTISTDRDTISFRAVCPTCAVTSGPDKLALIRQIDNDGKVINAPLFDDIIDVPIQGGTSPINLVIDGTNSNNKDGYITFRRIVTKKQQGAMLHYWLKGVVNEKDTVHFGAKDATWTLPGTWSGTTFRIDITKDVTNDDGEVAPVTGKMTFNFNADLSMVTTFDAYMSIRYQGKDFIVTDISGKNLPRTVNGPTEMIYELAGTSTCNSITRMDMDKFYTTMKWWGCDDECYIRLRMLK